MNMDQIKFGTDGWRAIIADTYTVENVRRVAQGTALWMQQKQMKSIVIGHDCRFGGKLFVDEAVKVFAANRITCHYALGFVSTPMVSLGVLHCKADMGVVITASHNPPDYNGFKLKSSYGGPTIPADIAEIEKLIPSTKVSVEGPGDSNQLVHQIDLEEIYYQHVISNFNLKIIQEKTSVAYDAMYGAGQRIMNRLFPNLKSFHSEWNPGFQNTAPEPITKNLGEIIQFLQKNPYQYTAIATDGDADRICMLDPMGNMVDSHHILLLLVHYLAGHKKMKGKIVVSFSVTNKLKKLADYYGLELVVTQIGFKYIAEYMIKEDVLVAGEESGGLAIKGHIPERDGVWIGLTILEFMGITGKSISELIAEVYQITGAFAYDRLDLHLNENKMQEIKEKLNSQTIQKWGKFNVINFENLDGQKYYFNDDAWLMFRASGTEPVLRIYAQSETMDGVKEIHAAARELLGC